MPLGVYVVDVNADSPAYNAGIQCGDIITVMGGETSTMKDFQVKLGGDTGRGLLPVTVLRSGRDEYKEIEYQITIGARYLSVLRWINHCAVVCGTVVDPTHLASVALVKDMEESNEIYRNISGRAAYIGCILMQEQADCPDQSRQNTEI